MTDPERPGVAAILDAWQAADGGVEPVLLRFALGTELGGALDAVAAYPTGDRWTLVTLGLTELGEKVTQFPDISGYGFEFTMRIPLSPADHDAARVGPTGVERLGGADARGRGLRPR